MNTFSRTILQFGLPQRNPQKYQSFSDVINVINVIKVIDINTITPPVQTIESPFIEFDIARVIELKKMAVGDSTANQAANDLKQRFQPLVEQWRQETGMYSSVTKIINHPAYQEIIRMGAEVLPLILSELRDRPAHWFHALKAITGETPVLPEEISDAKRVREAWLKWGKSKGLIS